MKMDAGFKKSAIFLGVTVAILGSLGVGFIMYSKSKLNNDHTKDSAVPEQQMNRETDKKDSGAPTAQYDIMSKKVDVQNASQANDNGTSYVPSFAPTPVSLQQPAQPGPNNDLGASATAQPVHQKTQEEYQAEQKAQQLENEHRQREMETQRNELENKRKVVDDMKGVFRTEGYSSFAVSSYQAEPSKDATSGDSKTGTGSGTTAKKGKILVKAGNRAFVSIDTAINTDEPSPVMATVLSGPANGMTVFGDSIHNPDDTISIKFNQLNLPDGTSVAITAYAVDPSTGRMAVEGSVDHKIFQRFVLPAVAGAGSTVAQIEQQNGMTMLSSPLSGTNIATYSMSPAQIEAAAVAGGVGSLSTNLNAIAAAAKPSVSTDKNLGLEIVFMKEVVIQPASGN